MKKEQLVKISAACVSLLLGLGTLSNVKAGEILKNGNQPFSSYPGTQNTYKIAFEVYKPDVTTTIVNNTVIAIRFDNNEISDGEVKHPITVIFNFPDSDAEFLSSSNYRWVLVDSNNIIYAASGFETKKSMITLTSDNVENAVNMKANTSYFLKQVFYNEAGPIPSNYIKDNNITPQNPSILLKKHEAMCSKFPIWKLSVSIAGDNGNIKFSDVTFAQVQPQFIVVGPSDNVLNARLDDNFQKFVNNDNDIKIFKDNFITIINQADDDWIVKTTGTGELGILKFNIKSENPEPGVVIKFNGQICNSNDNLNWNCNGNLNVGKNTLELTITGTEELAITTWMFENITFNPNPQYSQLCLNLANKNIGVWSGGLEAIVPFVKSDPAIPAETYFVFHNRRNSKVKLFAVNMLESSAKIINPKTLIAEIEPQSTFRITGRDLGSKLNISEDALKNGVPIKFLFTAPNAGLGEDPYIEGIVVSVYAGEQRSVPLKFRQLNHGGYNE